MKIGLNLLYLLPGVVGGTETYAVELIRALAALDRDNQYLLYVNRESRDFRITDAPNFRAVPCAVSASTRAARYGWEQALLPWQLAVSGVDLVHSLGYVGPLAVPCRSIVTIHDANFIRLRAAMSGLRSRALRLCCLRSARAADRLITVSGFSKSELVAECGVAEEKVEVIYSGPGAEAPAPTGAPVECYIRPPYLAAFCGDPHKNSARLVRSFAEVAASRPHRLVFIGRPGPELVEAIAELPPEIRDRVHTPGRLRRDTVASLLRGCELFVFPSLYEGFGLPVLEAQTLGAPVACSRAGSLPEVGGTSVEYFDPESTADLSFVLERCLAEPAILADLRRRGALNVGRFSWRTAAEQTLQLYRTVLAQPEPTQPGLNRSNTGAAAA